MTRFVPWYKHVRRYYPCGDITHFPDLRKRYNLKPLAKESPMLTPTIDLKELFHQAAALMDTTPGAALYLLFNQDNGKWAVIDATMMQDTHWLMTMSDWIPVLKLTPDALRIALTITDWPALADQVQNFAAIKGHNPHRFRLNDFYSLPDHEEPPANDDNHNPDA